MLIWNPENASHRVGGIATSTRYLPVFSRSFVHGPTGTPANGRGLSPLWVDRASTPTREILPAVQPLAPATGRQRLSGAHQERWLTVGRRRGIAVSKLASYMDNPERFKEHRGGTRNAEAAKRGIEDHNSRVSAEGSPVLVIIGTVIVGLVALIVLMSL